MPSDNDAQNTRPTDSKKVRETVSHGNIKHLIVLLLLLLLCYLSYTGLLSSMMRVFISNHFVDVSKSYLTESATSTEKTLEVISELKIVLALIQSSSGGISFLVDVNVQLGQAMSVIVELIDISWLVTLTSLFSIKILTLLLDLSHFSTTPFLTLFFALYGMGYALSMHFRQVGLLFTHLARTGLMLIIIVSIVLPMAVYFTASASHHFYKQNMTGVHQGYQSISTQMVKHNPSDSLHNQVKNAITSFSSAQKNAKGDATSYTHLTMNHAVYAMAEYILTPLVLFVLLGFMLRTIVSRLWVVR